MRVLFNFGLAAILFVVGLGISIKRAVFLMGAERTMGAVSDIHASNSTCGSKNNKYPCTKFESDVTFTAKSGAQGHISVSAGSSRGYDKPISLASLSKGSPVPVVFSPNDVSNAFHDTFLALWTIPLGSFFGSGMFFLGAVRRRRYS